MLQTDVSLTEAASRPLGTLEKFFVWLADQGRPINRGHWTIHLILDLAFSPSVTDPVPHLRKAWQALQVMQPHLGAVVKTPTEADDQQPPPPRRLTLGPLDLGDWVNTTFTACDQDLHMDELLSGLGPRDTATCYWVPSSSQLLIRSDHWRVDGSGMVMLGHEFLSALATALERGPKLALRHYLSVAPPPDRLLAPSLESIAQLLSQRPAIRQGEQDPAVEKAADALVADFLQALEAAGVTLPVCGLYLDGPPLRVDNAAAKGFSEIARQLSATYRRDPARFLRAEGEEGGDATLSLLELEEALTRRVSAIVQAPVPEGWPPAQTPDLSSLGVIDSRIQSEYGSDASSKVQLKNFWIGTEMLGRNIQFQVWTWNGQLTLSACFNHSYYEKQFVDGVLDQVLKELREGCHIEK